MVYSSDIIENKETIDKEIEDLEQGLFINSKKYIDQIKEKIFGDLYLKFSEDIENYMYEHSENVKRRYFNEIINFLTGNQTSYGKNKELLEKWLTDLGYDAEKFRKRIFEENKDIIIKQIMEDSIFDKMEDLFAHSYFSDSTYKHLTTNYPQTLVVKGFINFLTNLNNTEFNKLLSDKIDETVKNKRQELDDLKKEIDDIMTVLNKIKETK